MINWWCIATGVLMLLLAPALTRTPGGPDHRPPFDTWRHAFINEAVGRGFERRFVEQALGDIEPLPRVLALDRSQAQRPPPLDVYLAQRVTPQLVQRGREMMRTHGTLLRHIQRRFGIEPQFLVAIWGAETGYGSYTGDVPVFQALATLAWDPRRSSYFRGQLFDALTILDAGHLAREAMTGSWAGAMGQPQFMPSSYLEYAVDFDGDGRRDIWASVADTLASIAHYLQRHGWQPDVGWGVEAMKDRAARAAADDVPTRTEGCGAVRALTEPRALEEWMARGVRIAPPSGHVASTTPASLLTADRRAFLVSPNYETILAYNCSHRYALSVVMLADLVRSASNGRTSKAAALGQPIETKQSLVNHRRPSRVQRSGRRRPPIQLAQADALIERETGRRQFRGELAAGEKALRLSPEFGEHERLASDRRHLRRQRVA
jgi:membrane-bound lytic murein transglycosylase B